MHSDKTTTKTHNAQALSEAQEAELVGLLSRLKPGYLPFKVFHAVTKLVATPVVEIVPLRISKAGITEILLLPRDADDPIFPHTLHTPGTVVRASDTPGSDNGPLRRVLNDELGGIATSQPEFVKHILHHSGRGMEASQIYWVEVQGDPLQGAFYDVQVLPDSLMRSQLDFIPDAVGHFKTRALT